MRPSIIRLGRVELQSDGLVVIAGWGISHCMTRCQCHRNPVTGMIEVWEDQEEGMLGLRSWRPRCGCCEPWRAHELAAILMDTEQVGRLDSIQW